MEKNTKTDIAHPLLSIIVPIYRVEKYIEQCAISLFEQTLGDIEYIFVDDCSPDNSASVLLQVLNDYPSRRSNVKIIHHENNCGLAQARMTGFQYAKGIFLASIDSDDWIEPETFENLVCYARNNDSDVLIYDLISYEKSGKSTVWINNIERSSNPVSDLFLGRIYPIIKTCIFKRFFVDDGFLTLPTSDMAEDLVYSTHLLYYAKKVLHFNKPLYHYRYNEQSISKSNDISSIINRFYGILNNTNQILAFLNDKGLLNEYSREILHLKHVVKYTIWPAVYDKSAYKLWQETYPEIVNEILCHKYYSPRTRFLYLLTSLGVYSLYLNIKHDVKRLYFRALK